MTVADRERLTTLIGDVVASRDHGDRVGLQRSLSTVLAWANELLSPAQPLELALGDEFQGGFSDVATATRASLLLRLALLVGEAGVDSRYGLGHGEVAVFDDARAPVSQDGPGWWSARDAIERAKRLADSSRTSFVRTCFGSWPVETGASLSEVAAVEPFMFCRDATVERMNDRQRRLLLGLMLGRSQELLAAEEGITQGAVSQSLHRSGAFAIEIAQERLLETLA
jgi:hypothetical protein